jgi:hypothetical protein
MDGGEGGGDDDANGFKFFKPSSFNNPKKPRVLTDAEKEENLRKLNEKYEDSMVYDPQISTENRFGDLNPDAEDSDDSQDSAESDTSLKRKNPTKTKSTPANEVRVTKPAQKNDNVAQKKFPPITVKNLNVLQLQSKLQGIKVEITNVKFQLTSYGIKIHTFSDLEFQTIKKHCIDKSIEFFTHTLRDEKLTKIVLYGLPDFNIEFVREKLKDEKLFPVDIKKLKIKESKYDDQCHFLLYFKKSDKIKISQLREIKYFCNCVVRWAYYVHKRIGPTQCSNCQGFRHGTDNCYLQPKCIRCSQAHKSSDCPLINKEKPELKTAVEKLKCANCGDNHVASYTKCPERLALIKTKQKAISGKSSLEWAKRYTPNNRRGNYNFTPAPELDNFNFPALKNVPTTSKPWSSMKPQLDPRTRILNHESNKNDDLLTPDECFSIFNEFLNALSQCKTRFDQIRVIGEMTLKYMSK